jgi:hypothetical protein
MLNQGARARVQGQRVRHSGRLTARPMMSVTDLCHDRLHFLADAQLHSSKVRAVIRSLWRCQLQPLVLPQPSQT